MVSFLRKSLSRALWTIPKGIDGDAMRFQAFGAIFDWWTGKLADWQTAWLTGYVAQIASISCANVFLTALS